MIALIPARAGSKRIKNKNTKLLAGVPLIAYTIAAAQQSGVFAEILVCSDDGDALAIGAKMGVLTRPRAESADDEPDIAWVRVVLHGIRAQEHDSFAILRPTSPFRTAETIQRAKAQFDALGDEFGSLRAVQSWTGPHPGKMWYLRGDFMEPVDRGWTVGAPYHSSPTQLLPRVVRQNASLEMAYTAVITGSGTIAGHHISPFFTFGYEGLDINDPDDWTQAEKLIERGEATLPSIR